MEFLNFILHAQVISVMSRKQKLSPIIASTIHENLYTPKYNM